jgi:hypothetical protein
VRFTLQDEPDEYTAATWASDDGQFRLVVCPYAFGQYRVQLWQVTEHMAYPEVFGPHW